jgi:hypothetical protein
METNRKLAQTQPGPVQNTDLSRSYQEVDMRIFGLFFIIIFGSVTSALAQEGHEAPLLRVEPFSENTTRRARLAESRSPEEIARSVRYVYVRSLSALVTTEDIENKLRKHPDFQRLGMIVTRQEMDADLILEVRRGVLTKFVFTAIEPKALTLVASGKLSSLGGTVDDKVAKRFMKQIVALRGGG